MKLIRDRFNNCDLPRAGQAAMEVVTKLQNYTSEERVVAACAVFLFLSEASKVSVQDAMTVTKNMIVDGPRRQLPEFLAVRDYVNNEMKEGAE